MEIGTQEYLVTDCGRVQKFIDDKIGVEHEASYIDAKRSSMREGSVMVWDLEDTEHAMLRKFIGQLPPLKLKL